MPSRPLRSADASVGRPQVPEEPPDDLGRLLEEAVGNALLMRAQPEDAKAVEPLRDWRSFAVREPERRGEVYLIPRALRFDSRLDQLSEHVRRAVHDDLCELELARRVLDGVPRERTAVADQVAEQRDFRVAHRLR